MVCLMPAFAHAAELRDVRVWAGPDSTRVVFDLDGAAGHKLFTLPDPARVVIDLENTRRASALMSKLEGKGLVQRVRSAPRDGGGSLRVVLDVSTAVKPKSFALQPTDSYGYRVVVDLESPQSPAVAEAAVPVVAHAPRPTPYAEKPIVVAIDAGHGGEDPGTQSRAGVYEKVVCLAIAKRLARQVNQEPGFRAVLIRDGDYYIKLQDRVKKARQANADLFVSIHANSYHDRNMTGTAVYVLSPKGASSTHAATLANRENMADLIGGVDIQDNDDATTAVLIDIMQSSAMEASYDVGARLLSTMGRVNNLQKPRVQQASFMVLRSPDIPSVLVETAFLTNEEEARKLTDAAYQERMARSMLEGIKGYFHSYRPQQQIAFEGEGSGPARGNFQPVSLDGASAAR